MNKYNVMFSFEKQSIKCVIFADSIYNVQSMVIDYFRKRAKSLKGFKMHISQIGGG